MTTTAIDGNRVTLDVIHRAALALEAHNEGKTWEEAAAAAGYTNKGSAYRAAMTLLGRRVDAAVRELRASANDRHVSKIAMLEDLIYDIEQPIEARLRAVDAHTRAEARHARLNGIDAPVQVAISAGAVADVEDAIAEFEELLNATRIVPGQVTSVTDEDPDEEERHG